MDRIFVKRIILHLPILVVSVLAAVLLAQSDAVVYLMSFSGGSFLSVAAVSLVAGFFYSSAFTVAPATVALFEIADAGAPIPVLAIFGGLGGMLADISIFEIIRFSVIDDLIAHFQRRSRGHFAHLFKIKFFRTIITVLGAITIATPIPDEIGLAMMGIGKTRLPAISLITFLLNGFGIAIIGLLAQKT